MAVMKQAWELGLSNTSIPAEYNGTGLSLFDAVLVVEELAWGLRRAMPPSSAPAT
jgi:acyl-CoA dehydrogenase